jgi:hypothetical protein
MSLRRYFYTVSQLGHLYPLESRDVKQIPIGPTFLKDKRFLQFFYARVRPATVGDGEDVSQWPWLSVCGRELNFIKSASRTPIVFQALVEERLWYGEGAASVPFEPSQLRLSRGGELYHERAGVGQSLVASSVAFDLMSQFVWDATGTLWWKELRIETLPD